MTAKRKKTETQSGIEEQKKLIIKLKLPKKLEQHLIYLEVASKRSKDFIIQEALIRYLEDAEDVAEFLKKDAKKEGKTYTTKELLEHLNLKR